MKCRLVMFFTVWMLVSGGGTLEAQTNRKIKALQTQKKEIQKGLTRSRKELKTTEKTVATKLRDISMIANRLEARQRYIDTMEVQLKKVSDQVNALERKVERTAAELETKKADYARALRYARACKSVGSPLLFVLSTRSVTQMYRRSRYAREYANYQRTLAEQIVRKQDDLLAQKNELLGVKAEKNRLIAECEQQKALLQKQHDEEQKNVAGLRQRQKHLKKEVEQQQQQLSALDKKIDQMIAYEVEQARKRAEAARKKAEAEARRKAEKQRKQGRNQAASGKKEGKKSSSIPPEYKWITPQEQALNGNFARNKGRLPVPITGSYMVGSHFGTYNVPGLKNVRLDNKGTNYVGHPGAMARSIFDGEVSAVFQFGDTKNVLVRHGSYISVYCNLSSVRVSKGQKVKARDILGTVEDDGTGNCVLHFQLRKETQKLNPEVWIGR